MSNVDHRIFRKFIWNKSAGPPELLRFLADRFPYHNQAEWLDKLQRQILALESHEISSIANHEDLVIKVNNRWVNNVEWALDTNDVIESACNKGKEPEVCENFRVVYHDDHILGVVKPANIPVSEGGRYLHNTLVQSINRNYTLRPGQKIHTVHRIDKETSGIVIFALHADAARILSGEGRLFDKKYQAIITNPHSKSVKLLERRGQLHLTFPIAKAIDIYGGDYFVDTPTLQKIRMVATSNQNHTEKCTCVSPDTTSDEQNMHAECFCEFNQIPPYVPKAKPSSTKVCLIHSDPARNLSFVKCTLGTGRTHQIRVHMNAIGCPVLGDKLYGQSNVKYLSLTKGEENPVYSLFNPSDPEAPEDQIPTHLLHACSISFKHPTTDEVITLSADALDEWNTHPAAVIRNFVGQIPQ